MARHSVPLPDLVVANGVATSPPLISHEDFEDADFLLVIPVGAVAEVIGFDVSAERTPLGPPVATWGTLINPATGLPFVVDDGQAIQIPVHGVMMFRIHLGGNAAADRTFKVSKGFWA